MVLLNRYLKIFIHRNKNQRNLLWYTRLAAGMELLIVFLVIGFFLIRFGSN